MYYKYLVSVIIAVMLISVRCTESADSKFNKSIPTSPDAYEIALADGIVFINPDYPSFIENVSGISVDLSPFGRWSNGKDVVFTFKKPLPAKFDLVLKASVMPPNENKPIYIKVGKWSDSLSLSDARELPKEYRLKVKNSTKSKEIRITATNAVQPRNNDTGDLRIAFFTMKIVVAK